MVGMFRSEHFAVDAHRADDFLLGRVGKGVALLPALPTPEHENVPGGTFRGPSKGDGPFLKQVFRVEHFSFAEH